MFNLFGASFKYVPTMDKDIINLLVCVAALFFFAIRLIQRCLPERVREALANVFWILDTLYYVVAVILYALKISCML